MAQTGSPAERTLGVTMSLNDILPKPKHVEEVEEDSDDELERALAEGSGGASRAKAKCTAPPYGQRGQGWVPRTQEDFGDGGAYPEVTGLAQYPGGMGIKTDEAHGKTLALQVDAEGKVRYDALLRQGQDKSKVIHANFNALVPKDITKHDPARAAPTEEEVERSTLETKAALEKLVGDKTAVAHSKGPKGPQEATIIRYTPSQQGAQYNSGAKQRIIAVREVQRDLLEPPRFKTNKKLPGGPPSPPAPVLHSPPRKVSAEEQKDWQIPPCISNWKNLKGFTIPLDKRMAADGRGLQDVQINDSFAKLTEALYIAERKSREAIELRLSIQKKAAQKEKERKEESLRSLAARAREERSGIAPAASSAAAPEVQEREEIRHERRRERERDRRIAAAAPSKRAALRRDESRDVSERVALGLPATQQQGSGGAFDARLFNQSQGMDSGFGNDDAYNVYDKPWRDNAATNIYRPSKSKEQFDADDYEKIKSLDKFRPEKGFSGADAVEGGRSGPVQFEKQQQEDIFGLDSFLAQAKEGGSSRKRGQSSSDADPKRSRR